MSRSVVRWSDDAEKDLRRLDPINQRRVVRVVLRFAENGTDDIKRLQGPFGTEYRLRSGDLRIRFSVEPEDTIVVLRVLPRDKAYR
jgi:mRNA-degrading endonuclease RelE of RelBE toxin-antitoxin system